MPSKDTSLTSHLPYLSNLCIPLNLIARKSGKNLIFHLRNNTKICLCTRLTSLNWYSFLCSLLSWFIAQKKIFWWTIYFVDILFFSGILPFFSLFQFCASSSTYPLCLYVFCLLALPNPPLWDSFLLLSLNNLILNNSIKFSETYNSIKTFWS